MYVKAFRMFSINIAIYELQEYSTVLLECLTVLSDFDTVDDILEILKGPKCPILDPPL